MLTNYLFLITFAAVIFGTSILHADPYYNSSEAQCDGLTSTVVHCDDFETSGQANSPDGKWYGENCDVANAGSGIDVRTKGWCGSIFAEPITPAGAAVCGSAGAWGTDCAATYGVLDGIRNDRNAADHAFAPNRAGYEEIYARYFYKGDTGYEWGTEKHLTINDGAPGGGGIRWGNMHFNDCGAGSRASPANVGFQCQAQNQGQNIQIEAGKWYFIEFHMKLPTVGQSNGIVEFWMNDCGAAGTSCGASPTLRYSNTAWKPEDTGSPARTSSSELIKVLWFENWGNPGSLGQAYLDQVKVSTVGPIGFPVMGPGWIDPQNWGVRGGGSNRPLGARRPGQRR